jgi:hypothetical protein
MSSCKVWVQCIVEVLTFFSTPPPEAEGIFHIPHTFKAVFVFFKLLSSKSVLLQTSCKIYHRFVCSFKDSNAAENIWTQEKGIIRMLEKAA